MEFFCIAAGLGIIGVVVFFWNNNRIDEAWTKAANKLRIQFSKDGISAREISGDRAGFSIRVGTYKEGEGKATFSFTRYQLGFRQPLGLDLYMENQVPRTGFAAVSSTERDIVLGDPIFDPKVVVTGTDENAVREFLTPERRNLLLWLIKKYPKFELTPGGIRVAKPGLESNSAFLEKNIQQLIEVADKLGVYLPAVEIAPPPLPERQFSAEDTIDFKPAEIAGANLAEAEVAMAAVEEMVEVVEATVADLKVSEVKIAELLEPRPLGSDIAREKTAPVALPPVSELIEPSKPIEEIKKIESAPAPEVCDSLEFQLLCEELFDSGLSRFETGKMFDSTLKGQTLEGCGTLRRVDKYSSDRVFGRGPGMIAQIDILKLQKGNAATAYVQFADEGNAVKLREKIGGELAFSGVLLKCDPFTDRIYVGNAG